MKSEARGAYDSVAPRYADQFAHELEYKPLDRALLDCFAELVRGHGMVAIAAREFHRTLRPGGHLLLSFHAGNERIRLREWLGEAVDVEWVFFAPAFVEAQLRDAGLVVDASILRAAYTPHEHPSQRAYVLAHRPA